MDDLVSVIIPLYNSASTIERTLISVSTQTHRSLEILVVDDGSTDDGPEIVRRFALLDDRMRLLSRPNGGVAAARNMGIAHARGRYVAPVDADDLWTPDKIALQYAALERGGPSVGLCYCWYVMIDQDDRVMLEKRSDADGDVLRDLALFNIVGNGSGAMMRRDAVLAAGGYDAGLRAQEAEGCEDYGLYFAIAERYRFALIRKPLLGYRESPTNMSSDLRKALRSRAILIAQLTTRHPDLAPIFHKGRSRLLRFMLGRSVRLRRWRDARFVVREMLLHDIYGCVVSLAQLALGLARRLGRDAAGPRPRFAVGIMVSGEASSDRP
jgi:glycosyltransferase involved in cell wall biosynthesis